MTKLQRLEISGIRLFKPNPTDINKQSIDFYSPITLITGENGTGKTTIIETLKFATMGKCSEEMVSDIDIWKKDEVESRVSLTFKSPNQNTYTITLKPSVKKSLENKKKKSFKKGDCEIIMTTPDNVSKKYNINSNSIENHVSNLFGLSPSIIENVIFCNQKDSCWPIDCSTLELKEKFDQIFGVVKYNNAIKALKDTLNFLKGKRKQMKKDFDKFEEKHKSYKKCKEKISDCENQIKECDQIINKKKIQLDEVNAHIQEHNEMQNEIENKNKSIQSLDFQIQNVKELIEELNGKITNLQLKDTCKSNLESTINLKKLCNEELSNKKKSLVLTKKESDSLEKEKNNLSNQFKELSEKHKNFEIQHNVYEHNLNEFKSKYGNENLDAVLSKKSGALVQAEKDLINLDKKEVDDKGKQIQEKKLELKGESTFLSTLQDNLKKSKIIKVDENELKKAEDDYLKAKKELDNFKKLDSQDIDGQIEDINNNIEELSKTKEDLQGILKRCEQNAEICSKLDCAKEQLKMEEEKINSYLKKIRDGLNDQSIELEKARQVLNSKCNSLKNSINKLTKERNNINNDIISLSEKYKLEKSAFDECREKANKSKEKIDSVLSEKEDYYKECEHAEKSLNNKNNELASLIKNKEIYTDFKQIAEGGNHNCCHSCPLCQREFHDEDEFMKFVEEQLDKSINKLSKKINESFLIKQKFENRLKDLKQIENDIQTYEAFQDKKADWETKITSFENEQNEMDNKQKQVLKEIDEKEKQLNNLDCLLLNAEFLSEALDEKQKISNNIKSLSSEIDDSNLPSRDEVQKQINQNQNNLDELSNKLRQIYSNQAKRTEQSNQLNEKLQKFQTLKNIKTINEEIECHNKVINKINAEIDVLNNEFKTLSSNYEQQFKEKTENKNNALDEFKDCKNLADKIKKAKKELDELGSYEQFKKIHVLKGDLDAIIAKYDQKSKEVDNINNNISELNDKIRELEKEEINLKLQDDYYKKNDILTKLIENRKSFEAEKSDLLGILNEMNINKLKQKQKEYEKELIETETNKKNAEEQKKVSDDEIEKEYKTFPKDFNELMISLRSNKLAKSDIKRYIEELDKIIINYHQEKMDEINNTIQYLWPNIYTGNDIETLFIKSEKETEKNAQYNYRVVMVKNGVELDMDRRCSAGQKMLASIIIRLALAQTFAVNCGIISLDEPTTNLDEENQKKLASQLISLVNDQGRDNHIKSFQLIIISHYREFVDSFVKEGTLDNFYHIRRSFEDSHFCSQIEKDSDI